MTHPAPWIRLDAQLLRDWPLPAVAHDADKEARGRALVVAGSPEIAGAALLSGVAALRAGAGKLAMATAQSAAPHLSLAVPEARVIGLAVNDAGGFPEETAAVLDESVRHTDALLLGPGWMDEAGSVPFANALLRQVTQAAVVLDATAMKVVAHARLERTAILTPHAGEMASLLDCSKDEVMRDPGGLAMRAAAQWNAVVALKGATTWIASPGGRGWKHEGGHPGLGTSGSGDVLSGLVAGFLARGAALEQAAAWAVVLHAMAGAQLAARVGAIGFLARELSGEVPGLVEKLGGC